MATCRQCGKELPSLTLGELNEYCRECRSQQPAPTSEKPLDIAPPTATKVTATNLLLGINIAVFVAMTASGISPIQPTQEQLIRWGADYGPSTLGGQYWRTVTSAFLHIGILHLAVNMYSLFNVGRLVQKLIGGFTTLGAYLVTGIGASMLSLAWNPMRVSAGASGALFGFIGLLTTLLYFGKLGLPNQQRKQLLSWLVRIAFLNLVIGLTAGIDNMAHLGGFITGLVLGFLFARSIGASPQARSLEERSSGYRLALAGVLISLALLFIPLLKAKGYAADWGAGRAALQKSDYANAIQHFQKYVAAKPDDSSGHLNLAIALHQAKRYDEAGREYERCLVLNPNSFPAQVNLSLIYMEQGKNSQAADLLQRAISSNEGDAQILGYYGQALKNLGRYAQAEDALRKSLKLNDKDRSIHEQLADVLELEGKTAEAEQEKNRASQLPKDE
ncbi:MAG TPA: rhomboid family intramembrane serine protease [Candidatus Angelobacter sp.]|nr:rhomboid family intramembrane serine protease [Candidatus Angelobacter sp.]